MDVELRCLDRLDSHRLAGDEELEGDVPLIGLLQDQSRLKSLKRQLVSFSP